MGVVESQLSAKCLPISPLSAKVLAISQVTVKMLAESQLSVNPIHALVAVQILLLFRPSWYKSSCPKASYIMYNLP